MLIICSLCIVSICNLVNCHYGLTRIIIMKSLDPLRAKKIFIRKKLGHTKVSPVIKPYL